MNIPYKITTKSTFFAFLRPRSRRTIIPYIYLNHNIYSDFRNLQQDEQIDFAHGNCRPPFSQMAYHHLLHERYDDLRIHKKTHLFPPLLHRRDDGYRMRGMSYEKDHESFEKANVDYEDRKNHDGHFLGEFRLLQRNLR